MVYRILATGIAAAFLGGCGILSTAVGVTSQAAFAPVSVIASQANFGLQTIDHTATTIAASSKTTSTSLAQSARTMQTTAARAPVYARPVAAPTLTKAQKDTIAKGKNAPQPDIEVVPDDTLKKLSDDQRGLQKAAQKAALTAPVGETIFWDDSGRSGTAMAKEEHNLGATLCRTFEASVTIDGTKHDGHANACLDSDSGHWQTAF